MRRIRSTMDAVLVLAGLAFAGSASAKSHPVIGGGTLTEVNLDAGVTLRSTSLRAWIAAPVTVLVASVAMFATAAAAAGKPKPEVTAIVVRPIHDAQVVRGDDGKDHVEYDLLVVNVVGDPVTLSSVTVLDPAGKKLGRIHGHTLAAATQNLYTHAPVSAIPSSGAVAVEVDLALAPGTVPARVTQRIAYTMPAGRRARRSSAPPRWTALRSQSTGDPPS